MAAVTSSGSGERAAFLLRAEGVRGVTFAAAFSVVTAVGCLDTRMKVLMGAVAGGGAATIGFLRGRPRGRPEAPAIFDIWLWFRYFDTLIEERQARVKSDDDAVQLIVRNLEAADSIEVDVNKKVHSAKSWCSSFPSKLGAFLPKKRVAPDRGRRVAQGSTQLRVVPKHPRVLHSRARPRLLHINGFGVSSFYRRYNATRLVLRYASIFACEVLSVANMNGLQGLDSKLN